MCLTRRISSTFLAVGLLVATAQGQDRMPWQPSLEAAQQIAARTNRLVLLHFWSTSCKPCIRLEHEVFTHPEVAQALEPNFVMVKLNVDEAPGTAQLYGVSSIPTDVIIMPNGRLVSQSQSPPSPHQFVAQMNQAAAGHRALAEHSAAQAQSAPPAATPPPFAGAPPAGAAAANPNDRYADYFPQQPAATPTGAAAPAQMAAGMPPGQTMPPAQGMPPGYSAPPAQPQAAPGAYAAAQGSAMQAAYPAEMPRAPQLPPGSPPMGLDGYCPVTLVERQQWAMGDARFGAVHRGKTYLFIGPNEVKKFLADPERYAPVLSGNDPVLAMDSQQLVPGRREYGVYSDNRVYLFADEASRRRFEQNPGRYGADALQAASGAPVMR